jgi:hypothetical protein
MLAEFGIIGGALMVFRGHLPRYLIGGVIIAAVGILLAFSRVSFNVGFMILGGIAGLLPVVSGSVVFFLFLRQPAGTDE